MDPLNLVNRYVSREFSIQHHNDRLIKNGEDKNIRVWLRIWVVLTKLSFNINAREKAGFLELASTGHKCNYVLMILGLLWRLFVPKIMEIKIFNT